MNVVTVDWPATVRDLTARRAAIDRYRAAAAFHRALADELQAGCAERPCAEAASYRALARRSEAAAWLEEHNPSPVPSP